MYSFRPLPTTELLDLIGGDFVNQFQQQMDLVIDPLRKHIALGRPLSLGKELWEYAVADSIPGAEWNGAGHSIIDVKIGNDIGIDVKGVSKQVRSKNTTEASMFQNFDQNAKSYFIAGDAQGVWDIHVKGWLSKIAEVKNYYILGIIREKETTDCSLCGFKITPPDKLEYKQELVEFSQSSIKILGLVDPDFASIKYYNSKSRIEIVFKPQCWTNPEYALPIYKFS